MIFGDPSQKALPSISVAAHNQVLKQIFVVGEDGQRMMPLDLSRLAIGDSSIDSSFTGQQHPYWAAAVLLDARIVICALFKMVGELQI